MRALVLRRHLPIEQRPLELVDLPIPSCTDDEILLKVLACGLCHTDLDEIEGRLKPSSLPVILGHQVVAEVVGKGADVAGLQIGQRVGVTWLYRSCQQCRFCRNGQENLCSQAKWTGKDAPGGYAEYMVVPWQYAYRLPERFGNCEAAPLLCAGVIGYRAVRLAQIEDGQRIGLLGFGASAHIVIQVLRHSYPHSPVYVVTRSAEHQALAERLGAEWTGGPDEGPPVKLDRAIDFTPVGESIVRGLRWLERGGRLVVNAIRKVDAVGPLDYACELWEEKELKSVANVTRQDAVEFLPLAAEIPITPVVQEFAMEQVNEALLLLKLGQLRAAAVLRHNV